MQTEKHVPEALTIEEVFTAARHYRVPVYQRAYAWTQVEISTLLASCTASLRKQPTYITHRSDTRTRLDGGGIRDGDVVRVASRAGEAEAQGARLPSWNEWEYTAAADELFPYAASAIVESAR